MTIPGKSVKTQLIALLFGLTAVAILVLSFIAVRSVIQSGQKSSDIASGAMQQRVEQFMVQTAKATAGKNSVSFQTVQQETYKAAEHIKGIFERPGNFPNSHWRFDGNITRLPAGQYTNSDSEPSSVFIRKTTPITPALKRETELTSYLDYYAPQIIKDDQNAVALYFIGLAGNARYYPNISLAAISEPDLDVATAEFFTVAAPEQNPEKIAKWTTVYDDPAGNGLMITASHPIYASNVFRGIIGMDVTLNNIGKNIKDYSPIEGSYAFLVDNGGKAIALPEQGYKDLLGRASKKDEFGSDLSKVKGDFSAILQNMRTGKSGFSEARAGNEDLYVAYAAIEGTPFSMGIVARQKAALTVVSDLQAQVQDSTRQAVYLQILPFGLIILAATWFLGFVYIRRVTEPIKQLTDKTTRISGGDLDVEPAVVHTENEIGQLASSFNHMVADLKASRDKIEEQNKALLHTEQARLKASINSLNVGFIMTDTQNNAIMLNAVAGQILTPAGAAAPAYNSDHHWTVDEIDTVFGDNFKFKASFEKALHTGTPVEHKEVEFNQRILRIFMAPIRDDASDANQYLGAVVLMEDITDAKLLERSRDEFFSIASHELRTPLTAVRGNASLIQQVYSSRIKDADFDAMVGDIHGASVRLIGIVNDFLDATRLEQGRITFKSEPLAVHEVAQAVATDMATVAKEKGTKIVLGKDLGDMPLINADKDRVKQIIYNLLGNALKFTENGTITIEARVEGDFLKTLIVDTGPGISESDQRLLFRKFQQASNSFLTREARGTGLGLYISKLLSEQMGGRISLDKSVIGKGTTFSFTLPLAKD
jgi:two-component system, OmpR family, phosphate regulon sensor histidine kinase PhoR